MDSKKVENTELKTDRNQDSNSSSKGSSSSSSHSEPDMVVGGGEVEEKLEESGPKSSRTLDEMRSLVGFLEGLKSDLS